MQNKRELEAPPNSNTTFDIVWRQWLNRVYERVKGPLWEDMLSPIAGSTSGGTKPTFSSFGPDSLTEQYQFNRGESIYVGFHVLHNTKPGSLFYPHVHWSTDGTAATLGSSDIVEWEINYSVAKGHQQENFPAASQILIQQSVYNSVTGSGPSPTAWHHYITEASDAQAFEAPEVDSLILMEIKRGSTNDTYSNSANGHVFGLYVDIHYQIDRFGTPQKSPNFYEYNIR